MKQFLSSPFSHSHAPSHLPEPVSNVLGATGLPRSALKAMLLRDGLFGADSDLSAAEQATLQAQIGPIPGLAPHPSGKVARDTNARLSALAQFAAQILRTQDPIVCDVYKAMLAAGYTRAAVGEVIAVVRMVQLVFGARPIIDQGARLARIHVPLEKAQAA
jgi:hypothetical protein